MKFENIRKNNSINLILNHAKKFAEDRNSFDISCIDVLYGMLEVNCFAKDILENNSFTKEYINIYLSNIKLSESKQLHEIYTYKLKDALNVASEYAVIFNNGELTSEFILLSFCVIDSGFVEDIFSEFFIDRYKIAWEILKNYIDYEEAKNILASLNESKDTKDGVELDNKVNISAIDEFCIDMTSNEYKSFTRVFEREEEINSIIDILARMNKNNVCLVGNAGVGKTAIIEELANRIIEKKVPSFLLKKRLISIDMGRLIAGTKYRGEFEERIQAILSEAKYLGNIIFFIDELHNLVGTGGGESSLDAANLLKPALARGDFQIIGATTYDEYVKYIEKDVALERRFKPLKINEPSVDGCIKIMKGIVSSYSKFHGITIDDKLLDLCVKLSARYINDRFLPDKAIDLLDESCAKAKVREAISYDEEINSIDLKINNRSKIITNWMDMFDESINSKTISNSRKSIILKDDDIYNVVSQWTGIPISQIKSKDDINKLKSNLKKEIIGQDEVIETLTNQLKISNLAIGNINKPKASFIFCGNSGVGKTLLAKKLAIALQGDEKYLITIDMSEYMQEHSVSKLIGAPPGYVGYDKKGQLTEKIRRQPYSVVLFDEVEKAHPNVFNILLRILDEGKITDSTGRDIDFKNTIIILTSNIGTKEISNKVSLGFSSSKNDENNKNKKLVYDEVKRHFRPEFINRLDGILVFNRLNDSDLKKILKMELDKLVQKLYINHGVILKYTNKVIDYLLLKNTEKTMGARPINRIIQKYIILMISDKINLNKKNIKLSVKNNNLIIE